MQSGDEEEEVKEEEMGEEEEEEKEKGEGEERKGAVFPVVPTQLVCDLTLSSWLLAVIKASHDKRKLGNTWAVLLIMASRLL